MRDDQRSNNPSGPDDRRDAFDDALDDLFGPDNDDEPTVADSSPPFSSPPPATFDQGYQEPQEYRSPEPSPPPFSTPPRRVSGPGIRGWTWRQAGCYTCLGFFGIIFACVVILFIIGLITGDTADPAPAGHLWTRLAWG